MSDRMTERARRARAEARAAMPLPGEIVRTGTAKPPLHAHESVEERVSRAWQLTRRLWLFGGRTLHEIPRHALPGEVFDIRAERRHPSR